MAPPYKQTIKRRDGSLDNLPHVVVSATTYSRRRIYILHLTAKVSRSYQHPPLYKGLGLATAHIAVSINVYRMAFNRLVKGTVFGVRLFRTSATLHKSVFTVIYIEIAQYAHLLNSVMTIKVHRIHTALDTLT